MRLCWPCYEAMLAPYVGPMLADILLILEKMRNFEKRGKHRILQQSCPAKLACIIIADCNCLQLMLLHKKRLRALSVPVDFLMSRNFTAEKSGQKGFSLLDQQCIRSKRDIETLDF